MTVVYKILAIHFITLVVSCSRASAQCTTCDDQVEVTFRGAMCANGTFTVQLHDKTIGPVTGEGCGYYTPSPDGKVKLKTDKEYSLSISGSEVSTAHLEISCPPCYKVYIDGEEKSTIDESGLGCTAYTGVWTVVLKPRTPEPSGSGGDGDVSGGSASGGLSGDFSLGGSADGSAGTLSFSSGTISSDLFTPAVLNYVSVSPAVDVVRDSGTNVLRQIKAPEVLADIVTLTATSYEIRFYPSAQVGAKAAGTYPTVGSPLAGLYAVTGSPSRIWRISSPTNSASTPVIQVTEIKGSIQIDEVFSFISGVWMAEISGVRSETRTETILPNGDSQIDTTIFHPTTSAVASKVRDVYHAFPWGTEKVRSVVDPDGDALTTVWAYHENSSDPANYARLKWTIQPDGCWQRYDYYGAGGKSGKIYHTYRPWKNLPASPADATETNCHLTTYNYSSPSYYTYFQTEVSWRETRIVGTVVETENIWPSMEYLSSWEFPLLEDFPDMEYLPVVVRSEGEYYGRDTATLPTTSDIPEYLRGRLAYIREADGRQEIHAYEKGDYNPTTEVFSLSSTGADLREFITTVTYSNPYGVDGKTLQTMRITGPGGNLLREETFVKTASGFVSLGSKIFGYDAKGHLVLTTLKGRVTYEASWVNDQLASETDEQGITTTYDVYDAEGRVTQETRLGIVTVRVFDPAGNLTSTTRSSGSLSLETSTGYDFAGRVTSETSEDEMILGIVYTDGGRTSTLTRADTSTEITTRYLDGQTKSVTGTGIIARHFDYGTDGSGLWTKEFVGSESSPRYSQSWRDDDGQVWLTAVSRPSGMIHTTTTFHPYIVDRKLSRTVPGEAKILFGYDPDTGFLVREARDLNANDAIDDESDPINEARTSYVEDAGDWFRETVSSRYETDDNATPSVLSTTRERLTGLGTGIASVVESIDSQGHVTTLTTAINRATRTVTVTTDVPDSTLDAIEMSIDGKLHSTSTPKLSEPTVYSDYDALGRSTTVISPRGVVSTTVYSPTTGQVTSVTVAGKQTSYTYHPTGGLGAGNVASTTLPDTKVIRMSYTAHGTVFRVWGGATYPLELAYDSYGQQQFLKTYRGGTGWTSATWPASPGTADTTEWTYYEATGSAHQRIDSATETTTYTYYDASGKLYTRERARGPVTTYAWNSLGLPESVTHDDGTPSVAHTYDRAGRPKTLVDAAGTHDFTYPDDFTATETISGGILNGVSRSVTLDTYERLSSSGVTSGSASHANSYHYTGTSRLDEVVTGTETAKYGYLADSDVVETLTFKSGSSTRLTTTRSYDSSDRLDDVSNTYGSSQTQSFGVTVFDDLNRRKEVTREDATRWTYGYNDKGEVTSGIREKTASPNTSVPGWSHAYTFDEIGNRKTATINGRLSTYAPNALNQFDERTVPRAFDVIGKANAAATVTVDGNATSRLDEYFHKEVTTTDTGKIHIPYSVAATDSSGTTTRDGGKFLAATAEEFGFDLDGNLETDGRFNYTWDAENRLLSMEAHATVPLAARRKLTFSYDAMGRRIKKDVWFGISGGGWQLHHRFDFIHEFGGWNILAERSSGSSNGFLRTYTWGTDLSGDLSSAGGIGGLQFTKLHTSGKKFANGMDLNGNVSLLVNVATGQSAATYEYGPFGEPLRQSGEYAALNPFRFSTKYTDDETGLLDYGHRHYDPSIGRWLNRDPSNEYGGLNLYGFAGNDGVNFYDYLGLWFSDGRGTAIKNSYTFVLNGKGDYRIVPGNYGNNKVINTAAENHEKRHIAAVKASSQGHAVPYKQIFSCSKNDKKLYYYFTWDGSAYVKTKVAKGESPLWGDGVAVMFTSLDEQKAEEIKELQAEIAELNAAKQTGPITARSQGLTNTAIPAFQGLGTGELVPWTAFKKAYADEKNRAAAAGETFEWPKPEVIYTEIK